MQIPTSRNPGRGARVVFYKRNEWHSAHRAPRRNFVQQPAPPVSPILTTPRDSDHQRFTVKFFILRGALPPQSQFPHARKSHDVPVHRRSRWLSPRPGAPGILRVALGALAASRTAPRTAFSGVWCLYASPPATTPGPDLGSSQRVAPLRSVRRPCRLKSCPPFLEGVGGRLLVP
jgi:hypothetical protein